MYQFNIIKGSSLEDITKEVINRSSRILPHKVYERGLDVQGLDNDSMKVLFIAECLNWYGGYIHSNRFTKILSNLNSVEAKYKFLICAGVKPTIEQYQILEAHNIKCVLLPEEPDKKEWKPILCKALFKCGVIHSLVYEALEKNNYNNLPTFFNIVNVSLEKVNKKTEVYQTSLAFTVSKVARESEDSIKGWVEE